MSSLPPLPLILPLFDAIPRFWGKMGTEFDLDGKERGNLTGCLGTALFDILEIIPASWG